MAQKTNTIVLNGKRYDAVSGDLLGDTTNLAAVTAPAAPQKTPVTHPAKSPANTKPLAKPGQSMDVIRPAASHIKHHQANRSLALARHSVKKPTPSLKRRISTQQRTDVLVKQPNIEVKPKLSSYQVDPNRVQRSKQTPRHQDVSRYAPGKQLLPAASSPKPEVTPAQNTHDKFVFNQPALETVPVPSQQPKSAPEKDPSADIFEQALRRANSHEQKLPSSRKTKQRKGIFGRRALSFGATGLAILLVVGFFAWQQKAVLTMQYASHQAGVSANLPAYKPAGFSVGKFSYSPGVVAVNYMGREGDFSIIGRSSSWDSAGLRKSFVDTRTDDYDVISAAGRTIFTFDNNATWVDSGIWYQINSSGSLTTNDLVQLAVSM